MELFKRFRFYNIFDPNGTKLFGRNVYRLTFIAYTLFVVCTFIYGMLGYFLEMEDATTVADAIVMAAMYSEEFQILWQSCVFLYHADVVCEVFDVGRLNFLKSKGCTESVSTLRDEQSRSKKITNWYFVLAGLILVQWSMSPVVRSWFETSRDPDRRALNIINLRFPVTVAAYNKYYDVFYAIEVLISVYTMYSLIMFDVYTISVCRVIAVQYEILSRAFQSVGGLREGTFVDVSLGPRRRYYYNIVF